MTIVERIKTYIEPDKEIPKPGAKLKFTVKGWGKRRGHEALIYNIPSHKHPNRPHQKGVNVLEWEKAYNQLMTEETFSRDWFNKNMPECANEGGCNFTTIGGVFLLLKLAEYERGMYRLKTKKE